MGRVSSHRGGDDQVENVIFVVGRKVNMLSKVKAGEKREKLRGEVISRIIKMYVKVASMLRFWSRSVAVLTFAVFVCRRFGLLPF